MTVSADALLLLDRIEALEMRSLAWGFTSGSLTEDEVLDLLDGGLKAEDALEDLLDARLVTEQASLSGGRRYRSRFAEAVRLVAANRQLFANKPWQAAPRLVADFRIDRRRRRFPRRDRPPSEVLARSEGIIAPTPLRHAIWDALTSTNLLLAAFQERATVRLAQLADDGGTIVTAGTGSGKTIAFYLPAMLAIGEAIGTEHWVKALAIYPRVELLKDQFAEAFRMARTMDTALAKHGRRPLSIGALFRATPRNASAQELRDHEWTSRGRDWVCPWMRCPSCAGEMLWRGSDLDNTQERLSCGRPGCGLQVDERHLVLTRQRIQQQPPDLLFTTTEILNQRLSDQWMRTVFGIGVSRKPFLALLDEVHTYAGTSGAQAALTLRRWRHLLGAPVHWAGLSATLGDAARFFSDLTGASIDRVVEISPTPDEFVESGAEYQLLLRGDPASRASLLSTTIQTAMLVARVLDPPNAQATSGSFGRRAFLFTDDLDVTNRLFDDLRDAEAYTIFGQPDGNRRPLASLRAAGADDRARDLEGQRWRMCEDVGHTLGERLVIGRTTSQDAGVTPHANIIVATAALEVGFNDPQVGAVIQHKAPRGMASFLQRKGRAGRDRAMRPLTVTVLSDYGRDRATYESYESLFDPQLEPQFLPIGNPYVLKMQATFAFFDWLAAETAGYEKAWAWDFLSRPIDQPSTQVSAVVQRIKAKLARLIQGDETVIASLQTHLMGALRVDEDAAQGLLWEAPRSILLEVAPTLVRRLFRRWQLAFPSGGALLDLHVPYHPLPDFVPRNLFSDLSLPEVRVLVPPATVNHDWRTDAMPVLQAIRQLVPGRVTRRFAFERGGLSHWVPVDPAQPVQERRISEYAEEHEFVGEFTATFNDNTNDGPLLVFRPWTVRLEKVAGTEVLPSSNAQLSWRTDIASRGDPVSVPVAPRSPWRPFVSKVDFYLHRFRSSVAVRRFAPTAYANVRTLKDEFPVTLHFRSDDNRPAAIGFELEVDGLRLDLTLPSAEQITAKSLSPKLFGTSKLSYLRERFRDDDCLPVDINVFQRDWLFQLLCALIAAQITSANDVAEVVDDLLADERIASAFDEVMSEYFNAVPIQVPDDFDEDQDGSEEDDDEVLRGAPRRARSAGRLQQILASQIARTEVRERLRAIAREMLEPDLVAFDRWLRRLIVETLGEAMLQACIAAAPREATMDNLLVDIQESQDGGPTSVWITETTLGGAGALQSFAERFTAEPNSFFDAVGAALAPTDLELVDVGLRRVLALARDNAVIREGINRLRGTESHSASSATWRELSQALTQHGGVDLSHALVVALNNRLVRPGAGPDLDALLTELIEYWDSLEHRLGMAVGLREFAYAVSHSSAWRSRVRTYLVANLPGAAAASVSVFAAVLSMLWPRENEVRLSSLRSYNPYRSGRTTDPAVVRQLLLRRTVQIVDLSASDWSTRLYSALAEDGACRVSASAGQTRALREALVLLGVTPVDVGVLQFFPVVERIERAEGRILVDLLLREHS
ncbi:DEAD/DEAH box helicase [Aquabacterium lacunae]|uniref:DEAD/DEAH box helicase n=1 Tax=Aquabacterium lacunae TaxID=2528630 RepID=A0A4Q9GW77_9BURK|nr:protein DpdJ [Aquabacterium lacunae]TBO29285.1 DEAD/DEAH box helicase [Aquabacterium lacunae]